MNKDETFHPSFMHCIAIDDEPIALELLKNYISRIPFLELDGTFTNPFEAMDYLSRHTTDLIFTDIEMNEITGVQLISCLKQKPHIIFISAYERYAIDGFILDAVDYMLKPVSFERFLKGVSKAYDLYTRDQHAHLISELSGSSEDFSTTANSTPGSSLEYLFIKADSRLIKTRFQDILYIEGFGDYIKIHVRDRKPILSLQNLSTIETKLPGGRFARVHRSFIVSIDQIESIERKRIRIADQMIPISDTYSQSFFSLVHE